jgi:hypothetical protein
VLGAVGEVQGGGELRFADRAAEPYGGGDEPADVAEVLIHGSGAATAWLRDAGFTLETADGRVTATRA